jgi:DnaJ-class molecular chaperone
MINYFLILEISPIYSLDVIRRAYRKMALKHHPDRNIGDQNAAERFKKIQEAYDFLKDDQKRSNLITFLNKTNKKQPFYNAEYQRIRKQEMYRDFLSKNPHMKKSHNNVVPKQQYDNNFIDIYRKYYIDEDMPNIR